MTSRWMVCVFALLLGCGENADVRGSGGSGGTGGDGGGAAGSGGDETWFGFGKDYAHTRANISETTLVPETVGDLTVRWSHDSSGVTATPLVADGVVYWADWGGAVRAHNAATGQEIWTNDSLGGLILGSTASPFLLDGYLYVALRGGDVVKLDASNGNVVWRTPVMASRHVHVYGSPTVVDDVLVLGVSGNGTSANGQPIPEDILDDFFGNVHGIDADTGEILWVFETTIGPDGTQYGAGVSVWSSPTIDRDRGIAYIGTGNGYYQPVSPYSDAMLALDYRTGELIWHAQYTPGDDHTNATPGIDADVGATPNLFTIGERDVVGVGDKAGRYHVHDRDTGNIVWSTDFATPDGLPFFGSRLGGIVPPAAYHDGVLYIAINNRGFASWILAVDAADGSILWEVPHEGGPTPTFGAPTYAGGVIYSGDGGYALEDIGTESSGPATLSAFDASSGELLWSDILPNGRGGGLSVVDGMAYVGQGYQFNCPSCDPTPGGLRAYGL